MPGKVIDPANPESSTLDHELTLVDDQPADVAISQYKTTADFTAEDVWISRLRLAHGITAEVQSGEAKPGQWLFTGLPPMVSVIIVPLAYTKPTRRYSYLGNDKFVTCNNHAGAADVECPRCRTQYVEQLAGKVFNSTLEEYYQYMVYMPEHRMPAILEFARTAMNAGRQMNGYLQTWGFGNVAFKLASLSQINKNKQPYFVPSVVKADVEPSVLEEARSFIPARS